MTTKAKQVINILIDSKKANIERVKKMLEQGGLTKVEEIKLLNEIYWDKREIADLKARLEK